MPCRSSTAGICSNSTLLRLATSRNASFSISSGTWTPRRPARWTWISWRIRRSSTCSRMTSAGGSCDPWLCRRSVMRAVCESSWLCRTTPSLTIAITRSSATPVEDMSRVCARAAPASRNVHSNAVRTRLMIRPVSGIGGIGGGGVSPNAAFQESVAAGSDRRKAIEFHLKQDRVVALAGAVRHVIAAQEAQAPAAARVLETGEAVDRLVFEGRIDLPGVELPGRRQPPGEAGVPLLERALAVAVAEIHHRVRAGAVLDARVAAQRVRLLGVPLDGGARAPAAPRGELDLADEVGRAARLRHLAWEHDARAIEVETLADGRGEVLLPALGAHETRRQPRGQLVGVAEAVGADVAVGAKERGGVEVRHCRVERRQVVLGSAGTARVAQPGLERVHELVPLAGFALEHEARIERQDRRRAVGRVVGAGRGVRELVAGDPPGGARLEVIAGAAQSPGDARHGVGAKAGDAGIAIEPHRFGIERGFESRRHRPEAGECDLRQA